MACSPCPLAWSPPLCLPNPRLHMLKPALKVYSTYYIHLDMGTLGCIGWVSQTFGSLVAGS